MSETDVDVNTIIKEDELDGDLGNTQKAKSPRKTKQPTLRVHHFFTFNGYEMEDVVLLRKIFDELCYMYVFQEETGASGNKHLQGIISCKKPTRDTAIGIPKIHWEKPINVKDSYKYCSALEKRTGGCYSKNFEFEVGVPTPTFPWFDLLLNIINEEPNRRTVNWFWSCEGGTGKSTVAEYLVVMKKAVFLSKGKYSDIINIMYNTDMTNRKIVVFDLPRNNGNKISYDAIEAIKNGLICNTKFETGYKRFNPPHVIIFSNRHPDISQLSEDRWNIVNIDKSKTNINNINDCLLSDSESDNGFL